MDFSRTLDSVQDLMEELLHIQREKQKDLSAIERVHDIVEQSNRIVDKSELSTEIMVDAKILHTGSQVINSSVMSFDVNLQSFNEELYCKGIHEYIASNADELRPGKFWECLSLVTYHLYSSSTPLAFVVGSLSLDPLPPKERPKTDKHRKLVSEKTNLAVSSQSSQKEKEEMEENIYEHMLKSLFRYYKANGRKPLLFIDFIIDPESYWRSVENIFHFSFLVRDGHVSMFLNKENLLVVEPVLKNDGKSQLKRNHFSFSLSKKEWQYCIEKFHISFAKITPLENV